MMKKMQLSGALCALGLLFSFLAPLPVQAQEVEATYPDSISLGQCQRMAYENGYAIRMAQEDYNAAKAKTGEMAVNFFPQVKLLGTSLWVDDNIQLFDYEGLLGHLAPLVPELIRDKTTIDIHRPRMVGGVAVQPIFMGGKIITANNMSREAVRLRGNQVEIARRTAIEEAEEAYWLNVELQNKQKLARAYNVMLQDAQHDVELLLREGIVTQSDLLDIKVKLSESEVQLSQVEEGLTLAEMLLAVKCGFPATTPLAPISADLDSALAEAPLVSPLLRSQVTETVDALPEMQALRSAEQLAKMKINLDRSAYMPQIALVGAYGTMTPQAWSHSRSDVWGSNSFVGITVSLGITDAISAGYKVSQSKAQLHRQQWDNAEKRQLLQLKVQQAWVKLNESEKQIAYATEQQEKAKESLRMAKLSYNEGLIPLLQLTQAQTLWLKVETNLIDAQIAKCKAMYEIYGLTNPHWYDTFEGEEAQQ
jgi:outer membrane protein TolC